MNYNFNNPFRAAIIVKIVNLRNIIYIRNNKRKNIFITKSIHEIHYFLLLDMLVFTGMRLIHKLKQLYKYVLHFQ